MACTFCDFFSETEEGVKGRGIVYKIETEKGNCNLNPQPIPVTGLHCCSHFTDIKLVSYFFRRTHEEAANYQRERTERIVAEKKLKELRIKYRERKLVK